MGSTATRAQPLEYASFRAAAIEALGGDTDTLEFTASGWDACLGQAWAVTEGWARWALTEYRRVIDYAAGTSTQNAMRRAGLDPDRVGGCGAQVGATASPQQSSIGADANYAAKLPIWLTPHGVLRLADDGDAALSRQGSGFRLEIDVDSGGIAYRVVANYGADYLPTRIETWIDDFVFGDMSVVAEFEAYRDFGGIRFPATVRLLQGGLATLVLDIDSVRTGVPSPQIAAGGRLGGGPAGGRAGGGPGGGGAAGGGPAGSAAPAYTEIGDGVFVMLGAYQGVAVEFDEFSVVVDGMQSDARTAEIIRLTREAIPGKPIRYAVNTHSHFDHAGGLRQYAAAGATILTHEINVDFFRSALAAPRTLNPARIEPERVDADVQGVSDRFVIEDAAGQRLELIALGPSPHAADMLIGWLPAIANVVESDLLQPWINPVFAGSGPGPHPYLVYLYDELARAGLDYRQFVTVHNPPEPPTMPRSALIEAIAPDPGEVSAGHVHLTVPDVERHRALWTALGGRVTQSGTLELIAFPGIFVLLTEGQPAAPSIETAANHFGFSVRDFADYRARLAAAGASFFFEDAAAGQILADLPDGVRIEILTDTTQSEPIVFHHMHLSAADTDALREWYVDVFAAERGERRGLPSALVTGGRVDFIPARGEAPAATRGAAIDHIGFEVDDIEAFAARMARLGIEFDLGPTRVDAIGLTIAFITDPAGTRIEITEGLDDIE